MGHALKKWCLKQNSENRRFCFKLIHLWWKQSICESTDPHTLSNRHLCPWSFTFHRHLFTIWPCSHWTCQSGVPRSSASVCSTPSRPTSTPPPDQGRARCAAHLIGWNNTDRAPKRSWERAYQGGVAVRRKAAQIGAWWKSPICPHSSKNSQCPLAPLVPVGAAR